jgi:hypothetical protein
VRGGMAVLAVLAMLTAGACDDEESADSPPAGWPVGAAGMACQLLEPAAVEAALDVSFDTAGGATVESTYTCVLTRSGQELPDLTLSVSPSTIDELLFSATLMPGGAAPLAGLGRIAYSIERPGDGGAVGPAIEIGWLSASERLITMRYTFPAQATPEAVAALTPRLVALAQQIDATLSAPSPSPTAAPA